DRLEKARVAAEIGVLVREIRQQTGWNIHRLAKVADANMRLIHNLENGRRLPNPAMLECLLCAFTQDPRAPFK
ncbi:unnamed protein product, partial [marine sediment metagenome]